MADEIQIVGAVKFNARLWNAENLTNKLVLGDSAATSCWSLSDRKLASMQYGREEPARKMSLKAVRFSIKGGSAIFHGEMPILQFVLFFSFEVLNTTSNEV